MHRTIRFLTGGLASVAVASAITLSTPMAFGATGVDRPCGQPAVPAAYGTVVREPVVQVVPAVTHEEWRWEHEVITFEHQYSRTVSPAHTETDWVRPGSPEYQWSHRVVDREAVPAVPGTAEIGHEETVVVTPAVTTTVYEYVQQQTGMTRWEDAGWNGEKGDQDNGKGWTRTGATREDVVTPAVTTQVWVVDQPATPGTPGVPEVSHLEYQWSPTSPGGDWSGPLDTRFVGEPQATTTIGDDAPAGPGWTVTATREVPAIVETVWADDAPAGFAATGLSRVKDVTTEQTSETSATAPGEGWTQVPDSRVVVVDQPQTTVVVSPGSIEQVELTPAQPATAACPAQSGTGTQDVLAATSGGSTAVSGVHAAVHAHGASAPHGSSQALPETGNPVSPLLLTAGLGSLLAGGVLVQLGRRRRTS